MTFLVNFYGAYERGLVIIDITMACIFLGEEGGENPFLGIRWENTALGTESARNFFAIIGPLQLGVVLPPYIG